MTRNKIEEFDRIIYKIMNLPLGTELSGLRYGQPAQWDSIRHVELFISLQNDLKIKFSADEITRLDNYDDLKKIFLKKILE